MFSSKYDEGFSARQDRKGRFCNEVHGYKDPGVLLGYWFDERARIEAETEELLDKYSKRQLPFQKIDRYLHFLSVPLQLTRNLDGFLHHGDIIRLKWTGEDGKVFYLAALPMSIQEEGYFADPCLAVATEESRILVRTAFHVFRNNNNIPNHIPLMYNERIQFCTVESTGHRMLHCEPKSFNTFAKQSRHQQVTWEKELSARAIWNILSEDKRCRRRAEIEGQFVPVNTNVVISHLATGQFLALEKDTSVTTTFGSEKEVSGHTYFDTSKMEGLENKWQFEAPPLKSTDYCEPMVMPPYKD